MESRLLTFALRRMDESHDDRITMREIADYQGMTPAEVGRVLAKVGLKSRSVRRFGVCKGYLKADVLAAQQRIEEALKKPAEGPLNDYVCKSCGVLFEARALMACPDCAGEDVMAVTRKAPATKSEMTTRTDRVIRDAVQGAGLSDYRSADHIDPPSVNPDLFPAIGKEFDAAKPLGSAGYPITYPKLPGEAKVNPLGGSFSPQLPNLNAARTPTKIIGRDNTPLKLD
jgi:hypothetical protein